VDLFSPDIVQLPLSSDPDRGAQDVISPNLLLIYIEPIERIDKYLKKEIDLPQYSTAGRCPTMMSNRYLLKLDS
jgi:hypothetical protein